MKEGREIKKLGEVFSLEYGKPLDKSKRKANGLYPVYGANGIIDRTDSSFIKERSIIVGRKGSAGEINYTEDAFWPLDVAYFVKYKKGEINLDFLFYLLSDLDLPRLARGVKPGINRNDVYEIKSSIPSFLEQQKLVAILDVAFTAIDQAKKNIQRNLQNVKELFQSELNNVFTEGCKGCIDRRIDEVSTVTNGFSFNSFDFSAKNKIKSVKITNVGVKEFIEESNNFLPESFISDFSNYQVKDGDIVIALTRTIISNGLKVAIVPPSYDKALLNQRVAALSTNVNMIKSTFLYSYLCTSTVYNYVIAHVNTLMQPNLSINDLKKLTVPTPSIEDQKKIITKLQSISNRTKQLERLYRQKLLKLELLKKSLLQKAFRGELANNIEIEQQVKVAVKVPYLSEIDLHAGLIALALKRHEEANEAKTFHHVKSEKIIHLVEYHLDIDLGRNPVKDAAGPNDFSLKLLVEREAKKADYFAVETVRGIKNYIKGNRFELLVSNVIDSLQDRLVDVDDVIKLMIPLFTKQTEIVATLYAAWNNLLLDKLDPTDEAIVFEARENWHENKLKIPRERFFKAIIWMKDNNLVPKGTGKKVLNKQAAI